MDISYPHFTYNYAGTMLCAKDDCDHLDCHGGPFLVVFVEMIYDNENDDDKDLHTYMGIGQACTRQRR